MAPKKKILRPLRSKLKKYSPVKKVVSQKVIKRANKTRKRSSFELALYDMLNKEGIKFKKEKVIGRCHVDVFIEPNIVIEANGDYWHRCSIHYPEKTKENLEIRMKDTKRYAFFRSKGYEVHTIRECEFKENPDKIREKLKLLSQGL